MHDWTLISILFEWGNARAVLKFRRRGNEAVEITAEGVSKLHIPQINEWGPSVSVNHTQGPTASGAGDQNLCIEMQSGDVIEITATSFIFPAD